MSLARFQSLMARLIAEPDYRDAVRARGAACLAGEALTPLECERLLHIADSPGLDVNRTLHKGFRLGKLRALLPLTCERLGPRRLAREVAAFWAQCPPSSFYFIPEALSFCRFLAARRLRVPYLGQVLAYERATLELERARVGAPPPQRVSFAHDPVALLGALLQGRTPHRVPRRPVLALGSLGSDGRAAWRLLPAGAAQPAATRRRQVISEGAPSRSGGPQ